MVEAAGQWRGPRTFDAKGPAGGLDGRSRGPPRSVVSFASNDYLGLTSHPAVVDAAHRAIDRWGAGSGASRLVTGSRPVHAELEQALADVEADASRPSCSPPGSPPTCRCCRCSPPRAPIVFSDELNHASIIDGCRTGPGRCHRRTRTGISALLDAALARTPGRPIIVTDTVFSMDGDHADLDGLVRLAGRHGALLVLDEAHAVLGPELRSDTASWPDVLRVGTLSKTLGSLGGFVAGPRRFVELLVNRARPYIFTTAPTPADAAAALAAVGIVRSERG